MKKSPFKIQDYSGNEIFTDEIAMRSPIDLCSLLIAISATYGLERVENAVKNTFTKDVVTKIFEIINFLLSQNQQEETQKITITERESKFDF